RTMAKNRKVETIVVSHVELVSDWDAKDKRSSDYGTPPVNTGRETRASWRDPISELVPLLAEGYDPVKGAITAVRLEHYQELTGRTGKDILAGQLARADAYADSDYHCKIAMTGDLDSGAVSRELDGKDVAFAIRQHYDT